MSQTKPGRNDLCPCGSGLKYKRCCGFEKAVSALAGLMPGIRMKGGIRNNPNGAGFIAMVHTWDNVECLGEPMEWRAEKVFATEEAALQYYKTNIRPALERMMTEFKQKNTHLKTMHRRLE
ncbi:SEC-C domain-containing protein [candidate division KSB1 bacterium]|nr:SEC-C domain-containing protein [candidate division KSB1 bacterium]